jgi:hypothetical protein
MKIKLIIVTAILIGIISTINLFANSIFQANEYLEYDVSYLGIKLGTITVKTLEPEKVNNQLLYKASSLMQSAKGIPFISLYTRFTTWMSENLAYSYKFVGDVKTSEGWDHNKIFFDYEKNKIYNKHWLNDSMITNDVFDNTQKVNDGCSLFFYARQYANLNKNITVPTFIDDVYKTKINFTDKIEPTEIDAIPYPVRTKYLDGKAEWEGIYGLTGKFKGWFSDDEARIPIVAYMNVYVGKVVIELKKWKREGWTPPKYIKK